jgi:TolB-like protein/tetratricopeptide (TPR) repeat protein
MPSAEEVRKELEQILASPDMQASEKRREFLRYIVEAALAGHTANLKGYTIAVDVFGRDESFDAQSDAVVRIEARRLRRDLDSYYMNAGTGDSVRISIPKGAYAPHFEKISANISPETSSEMKAVPSGHSADAGETGTRSTGEPARRWQYRKQAIAATVVLAILLVALAIWKTEFFTRTPEVPVVADIPAVVVLPFEALGSSDTNHYLAAGISQELVNDLARFPGFRLYMQLPDHKTPATEDQAPMRRGPNVAYTISGSVLEDGEIARVLVQLVFTKTGQVIWSESYNTPMDPNAMILLQRDMAGKIATALGQPYGYIHGDLVNRMETPEISSMQSYICVLRANEFRRSFSRELFAPILGCLEHAVQVDPNYSDAWAMLSWLHMDAGRLEFFGSEQLQTEYDRSFQAASRAVQLSPENTRALKALASINYFMGRYTESERLARRVVELNPNDPEALAQFGWRLAARGNFREGIPNLERAIERTVNPPGWYYHFIAIDRYLAGDYEQMLIIAERSAVDESGFSHALLAIANGALGRREETRQALLRMADHKVLSSDPAAYFLRHGGTDEIVEALSAGLAQAEAFAFGEPG